MGCSDAGEDIKYCELTIIMIAWLHNNTKHNSNWKVASLVLRTSKLGLELPALFTSTILAFSVTIHLHSVFVRT